MAIIQNLIVSSAFLFLFPGILLAKGGERRQERAHVHGEGSIDMAFEEKRGRIEMDIPAATVLGFEHKASSAAEKKTEAEVFKVLREQIFSLIDFESRWKCTVEKQNVMLEGNGAHKDLVASYDIACETPPSNGFITFNLQTKFPLWKKVKVQFLSARAQKVLVITRAGEKLEIK